MFPRCSLPSPQEGETEFHTHVNRIVSADEKETELDMYSSKNPNTTTAAMQAVILEVEMPKDGKVIADFNGKKFEHIGRIARRLTFALHDRLAEWKRFSSIVLCPKAASLWNTIWKIKSLSVIRITTTYVFASVTDNGHGVHLSGQKECK